LKKKILKKIEKNFFEDFEKHGNLWFFYSDFLKIPKSPEPEGFHCGFVV